MTNKKEESKELVPSYMNFMGDLDDMGEVGFESSETEGDNRLFLPWVNFTTQGKIVVTNQTSSMGPDEGINYEYEELPILLFRDLTTRVGKRSFVGRRAWKKPYDPARSDGNFKFCESPNGLAPWPQYVGTEVTLGSQKVTIGRDISGEIIDDGAICLRCPVADWDFARDVAGLKGSPCQQMYSYLLWNPDIGIIKLIPNNVSVHLALRGVNAGERGGALDGSALPGIRKFFTAKPESEWFVEVRPKSAVPESMYSRIIGISPTEKEEDFKRINVVITQSGEVHEDHMKLIESSEYLKVKIPTYPYAPEGLPDDFRYDRPIYKVYMLVTQNNYATKPHVPTFRLSDEVWDEDAISNYMADRIDYTANNRDEQFKRIEMTVNHAKEWAASFNVSIEAPPEQMKLPFSVEKEEDAEEVVTELMPDDDLL